ncbi:MAG: hypothetical protein L0241_23525 [Planctomycetia bacterium]|nr:hypothetical protein [Planctomycetia bacterium]
MNALINELYELSVNTALFEYLRKGGDLKTLSETLAKSPTAAKSRKPELLASIRAGIVSLLASGDSSRLHQLIQEGDTNTRVTIVGELILTLHALPDGKHAGAPVEEVLQTAFELALDIAVTLEAEQPQDTDDAELLAHGIAMREWAHLFAGYYRAIGKPPYEVELLMIRARATNSTLSAWPHLVGAAMVDVARALEGIGKAELTPQFYTGVRLDLRYLIARVDDPKFPEFPKISALYWLEQACAELARLTPDDAEARDDLQNVRALRKERNYPDAVSAPRFGPIAQTYLDRIPYLACIIRDINIHYDEDRHDESVFAICQRYGCDVDDVEFYISAIGSYDIRDTILAGVTKFYDEPHEEVFSAIEHLNRQKAGK